MEALPLALLSSHGMLFHKGTNMLLLHGITLLLVLMTKLSQFPLVCSDGLYFQDTNHYVFDVIHYGARANGREGDNQAFSGAWNAACTSGNPSVVFIPKGEYFLNPISFEGPCKSQEITVQVVGDLIAPREHSLWNNQALNHWLQFRDVNGLTVEGWGSLDGSGKPWWDESCRLNKTNSLQFSRCADITLRNMNLTNSKQVHINFEFCNGVKAYGLNVFAPYDSPNTDGIHKHQSKNVVIHNITVGTGDDCISMGHGSSNIHIQHITCGPGHGISVGSLGGNNQKAFVRNVTVSDVSLFNTDNGLRIKTWQGGKGRATRLKFSNVEMRNVKNPILIDQYYCPHSSQCHNQTNGVQISKVSYSNITGTSATRVAVQFSCTSRVPCLDISLHNVHLIYVKGEHAVSTCYNAQGSWNGVVYPPSCLLHSN